MASTPIGHPYEDKSWNEIVPEFVKQPILQKASVVQDRSCVRYIPQGGQQYTQAGPSMINIMMSDSSRFLDPNSARLSGSIVFGGAAALQLSDGITSLFQRLRVLVNGQTVEDINFCSTKTAMEVYASMPYEHYESQASALGLFHKYDRHFAAPTADVNGVKSLAKNQVNARRANVAAALHTGESFSLPLSYISGFFRQSKAFPLLLAGNIQILIDISPSAGLRSAAAPDAVAWTLSDLSVECDMLQMHPIYTEAFASLTRDPSGPGYKVPFTTHAVQQVNVPAGSGMKAISVPNAVRNLRQLSWVIQDQASLSLLTTDKTAFPLNSYNEGYVQVGSKRFPDHPCKNAGRALAQCLDADNELANIGCAPIIDIQNYCGILTQGAGNNDADAAAFIWSASFDKVKDTYLPLDGLQSLSGLCTIYVDNTMANAGTMTVVAETTRFLSMSQGQINIE